MLEVVDALEPSGTPLTTPEVAAEFDCTGRTVYNKLETLVEDVRPLLEMVRDHADELPDDCL